MLCFEFLKFIGIVSLSFIYFLNRFWNSGLLICDMVFSSIYFWETAMQFSSANSFWQRITTPCPLGIKFGIIFMVFSISRKEGVSEKYITFFLSIKKAFSFCCDNQKPKALKWCVNILLLHANRENNIDFGQKKKAYGFLTLHTPFGMIFAICGFKSCQYRIFAVWHL